MAKGICMLLVSITLMTLLISCSMSEKVGSETTAPQSNDVETEPERLYPDLPEMDYEGRVFTTLVRYAGEEHIHNMFEFYVESMNGEILNDEIYARNMAVEERYNVKLAEARGGLNPSDILAKEVQAGDTSYSVCVDRIEVVSGYVPGNIYYCFNDIPNIDLSMPWWNKNSQTGFSIGGKVYFCSSDYLLFDKQRIYALFFNKSIAANYDLGDLYGIVESGKWTMDLMNEMSEKSSSDLNGDASITFDDDQYGIVFGSYDCYASLLYSMDNRISTKDSDDMPVLTLNNEKTIKSLEKLSNEMFSKEIAAYGEEVTKNWSLGESPQYIFEESRALFYLEMLHVARLLNTDIDYGIIPLPKFDESQEQYLTAMQYIMGTVITVPINSPDIDFTGFMLEALSAESKYTTLSVFIETVIKTKKAPDERAPYMIDLMFDGIVYDIAACFNWGGLQTLIANTIPKSRSNNFASEYAALSEKAEKDLQKTVNLYISIQS